MLSKYTEVTKSTNRVWDDTHRKSTGISAGEGAGGQSLHPRLLLPPVREAGKCFVEVQEQPLPRTPSPLKEGEPRQRAQTLLRRLPATEDISW